MWILVTFQSTWCCARTRRARKCARDILARANGYKIKNWIFFVFTMYSYLQNSQRWKHLKFCEKRPENRIFWPHSRNRGGSPLKRDSLFLKPIISHYTIIIMMNTKRACVFNWKNNKTKTIHVITNYVKLLLFEVVTYLDKVFKNMKTLKIWSNELIFHHFSQAMSDCCFLRPLFALKKVLKYKNIENMIKQAHFSWFPTSYVRLLLFEVVI